MVALYVTSLIGAAGKTMICAGLGKNLLNNGKKVGFFKPIIAESVEGTDGDALFMKQALNLDEPVDSICPVISGQENPAKRLRKNYHF